MNLSFGLAKTPENAAEGMKKPEAVQIGGTSRKTKEPSHEEGSFKETLQKVSEDKAQAASEKTPTPEAVDKKIETVSKKIESISEKNPDLAEGLKKLLEEIKLLLKALKSVNNEKTVAHDGAKQTDALAFLSSLLDFVNQVIKNPNDDNLAKLKDAIRDIKVKLDGLSQKLAFTVHDKPETAIQSQIQVKANAEKLETHAKVETNKPATEVNTKKNAHEKVAVVDKRTQETKPVASENAEKPVVKSEKPEVAAKPDTVEKPVAAKKSVAVNETRIEPKAHSQAEKKEVSQAPAQKSHDAEVAPATLKQEQAPQVAAKQYTHFAHSVNKANLEAMMQTVTGKALVVLKDGKSEVKLNLTPPELGRMSLKFSIEDGVMIGKIVVSTPEAKQLFDQNLGEFQRMMQQAGINVGNLDVSLSNGDAQNQEAAKSHQTAYGKTDFAENWNNEEVWAGGNFLSESSINYVA